MASKSKFILAFLFVLCFMFMKNASGSDCKNSVDHGCFFSDATGFPENQNRKVVAGVKWKSSGDGEKRSNGWELRKAPTGPDPLHHNIRSPKKPRTP